MRDSSKPLSIKTFKYIFSRVPRLCLDLVIRSPKGALLTKRAIAPAKGFWHLPGGSILFKESVEAAVQRICERELGTKAAALKFLQFIEYYKYNSTFGHTLSLVFEVKPQGKIKLNDEASAFDYFKIAPPKTLREVSNFLKKIYG